MEQVYVDIQWDKKKGKKIANFSDTKGGKWGSLPKSKANATAVKTGDGVVVVDIDTKNFKELDHKLLNLLGKPTVETKRGYHYYYKVDKSKDFTTSTDLFKHVDIRSDGGLVFTKYWGDNDSISYEKVGDIKPMPKKLAKYLLKTYSDKRGGSEDKKKTKTIYNNTDKKKMKTIMKHINCYDDYTDWYQVGMALKDWDEVEGLKIWDKWSKQSEAYERGACEGKWGTFKENGDIGLGTLYHLAEANGYVIEREPDHTKKKGKGTPLGQIKNEEVKKQYSTRDRINELKLTSKKAKEMLNVEMLYPNLLAKNYHSFIFGEAGSNKTTVIAALSIEMAQKHNIYVNFWSFDAAPDHNAAIHRLAEERKVDDKFSVLAGLTIRDFEKHYDKAIEDKEDLTGTLIVLDTFKYLTENIQNKNSNKDAMHYIKKLLGLGASFISLGHTNKDGEKQSGTAEIEQDSDAIFRIDRMENEDTKQVTVTIKKAGRVRHRTQDMTFTMQPVQNDFWYSSMESVTLQTESVDVQAKQAKNRQKEIDSFEIGAIKEILSLTDKTNQKDIIDQAKLEGLSDRKTRTILKRYENDIWNVEHGDKNAKFYKLAFKARKRSKRELQS